MPEGAFFKAIFAHKVVQKKVCSHHTYKRICPQGAKLLVRFEK